MALVLDVIATLVSGGQSTHEIAKQGTEEVRYPGEEYAVSQVFIAIDATSLMGEAVVNETVNAVSHYSGFPHLHAIG